MDKKIAACCCTWHRPQLLGRLIQCFLEQDYPRDRRELIILDDAGMYQSQATLAHDGWQIFSIPRRFRSLGEKRNAVVALTSPDTEYLAPWDDDDLYLPHALSACVAALDLADWSRPSQVLVEHRDHFAPHPTEGLFHASWAFRRTAFQSVGGYRAINNGEDQDLAHRLLAAQLHSIDPLPLGFVPFSCHSDSVGAGYHVSSGTDWQELGRLPRPTATLHVGWPRDYRQLPIRDYPHRHGRTHVPPPPPGGRRVRLCGPVPTGLTQEGPNNGMFALQTALREQALDWLQIGGEPQAGELAWWWHYDDRERAVRWDRGGYPALHGPNMFFMDCRKPRSDALESQLLDARNCRAILCHTPAYQQLIAAQLGPEHPGKFVLMAYPAEPPPPPPLPEPLYDVLLYLKSGHSPKVVHHLKLAYPNHYVIQYGQYDRSELGVVAAASRACVYFSQDDSGPLALEEIVLAGCPCVGLPQATALLDDQLGQHLPDLGLTACLDGLAAVSRYDRQQVALRAGQRFLGPAVVSQLLPELDRLRQT